MKSAALFMLARVAPVHAMDSISKGNPNLSGAEKCRMANHDETGDGWLPLQDPRTKDKEVSTP